MGFGGSFVRSFLIVKTQPASGWCSSIKDLSVFSPRVACYVFAAFINLVVTPRYPGFLTLVNIH